MADASAALGEGSHAPDGGEERTLMASSIASLSGAGVVIQFTIEPDGFIQPVEFPLDTGVGQLKEAIATDMGIPAKHLVLRLLGRVAPSACTLAECGLRAWRRAVDGNVVIDPTQTGGEYRMPRVLVVSVTNDETGAVEREVIVRVARATDASEAEAEADVPPSEAPWAAGRKPYLGGFRDKRSGLEYHHAATQTRHERRSKWEGRSERVSRDTQTPKLVTRSAQTKREAATQMERRGLSIAGDRDRVVTAQPYVSADELDALREGHVRLLQRCWRGFTARSRAAKIRAAREEETAAREEAAAAAAAEAAERHRRDVDRRLNPRTKADFAALFGEVEAWRQAETARIKDSDMTAEERGEALAQLLAKQTAMLATVDGLRTKAIKEAKATRVARMLDSMAEPQKWETGDGAVAVVHTPFSARAAELKALYAALMASPAELAAGVAAGADGGLAPGVVRLVSGPAPAEAGASASASAGSVSGEGKDEDEDAAAAAGAGAGTAAELRVRVLLQVKWTVKEFDCGLTREIVELIDREADLLARGRPSASLKSLRKRLGNLFLQFVETPEFNPEAARFQRVQRDLASRPHVAPITKG